MSRREGPLGDEQYGAEVAKADAAWTRQYEADLKCLIETEAGVRFFGRLILNECGCLEMPPIALNAESYIQAGKRKIGDSLLGRLERIAPGETRLMLDRWFKDRYEWRTSQERAAKPKKARETDDDS